MNSVSYWEKRKAQEMFEYMAKAEDAADEIAKLYQKSSGYLSAELDKIFTRYKHKHHLTDAEAYRLLNRLHDKTSIEELKMTLRAGGGVQKDILAELESPAYQARLERLQQLQNKLDLTMREVYRQEKTRNTSHYVDLANEAYYRSIFNIQQRTGLRFSFGLVDTAVIDRVINSKWSGANYSTRIWRNTQALAQDLKEELLINLVTGRTDREVAEIIANKYAQGASNARRLVRTESCNLVNQMEMESYKECGIESYRFVATLDLRTSSVCRKLDGKRFKVSEQQPGKNCPPMHPWCRSTTVCDISDEELAQMERWSRDPITGKSTKVPANMTYGQWYQEKVMNQHPFQNERKSGMISVEDIIQKLPQNGEGVAQRKKFADKLVKELPVDSSNVKISIKGTNNRGYCSFSTSGNNICNYQEYVLQADDDRDLNYKTKTAFHEAYHLSLQGKKWDIFSGGQINEKWRVIEETFAEAAAHYASKKYGINEKLAPAYQQILVKTLPRLKRTEKFRSCVALSDIGEIAWQERLSGGGGSWSEFYDELFLIDINEEEYYKQYFGYIKKHEDALIDKVAENSPVIKDMKDMLKEQLEDALRHVEGGGKIEQLYGNQKTIFSDVLVNAMQEEGIK